MNISFSVDAGWLARPDELARRLAVAVELSRPPAREPGEDDAWPHYPEKPRIAPDPGDEPRGQRQSPPSAVKAPIAPMTGAQLLGWIGDRADAKDILKRAQSLGKARGYGWQIKGWKPDMVQDIWHDLVNKPAPAPARGAKRP